MTKKTFVTPDGRRVEDEAVEVEPVAISCEELVIWEYDDPELSLRRVVLDPHGVRLWKAVNERDDDGHPLMSFEPHFEAEPWDVEDFDEGENGGEDE
jgi:hypothetical protein